MTRTARNLLAIALGVGALWSLSSNPEAIGPVTWSRFSPLAHPTPEHIASLMNPDYTGFIVLMARYGVVLLLAVRPHPRITSADTTD